MTAASKLHWVPFHLDVIQAYVFGDPDYEVYLKRSGDCGGRATQPPGCIVQFT